ncbi:MAG: hypothetical protein IJ966_02410 [Bacilli bacterium]|jgi:hypothetical protein|nr:hypothetical protein [Bacilli bacterium]
MRNLGNKLVLCGILLMISPYLNLDMFETIEFDFNRTFTIGIAILLFGFILNAINNDKPEYIRYKNNHKNY